MKRLNLVLVALLIVGATTSVFGDEIATGAEVAQLAEIDERAEPSDSYRLIFNNKELPVFIDRAVELPEDAAKASVRLVVEPDKHFNYGGISLNYPRYFTFEADLDEPGVKLWSLSGHQAVLMVQRYPVEMKHRTMAEQLLPSFGEGNTTLGECEITLAGTKNAGSRVVTTIGEGTIAQEIYSFEMTVGSLLLIIQDTLEPDGKNSEEYQAFREQLGKTFKIVK